MLCNANPKDKKKIKTKKTNKQTKTTKKNGHKE